MGMVKKILSDKKKNKCIQDKIVKAADTSLQKMMSNTTKFGAR